MHITGYVKDQFDETFIANYGEATLSECTFVTNGGFDLNLIFVLVIAAVVFVVVVVFFMKRKNKQP